MADVHMKCSQSKLGAVVNMESALDSKGLDEKEDINADDLLG